MQQEPYGRGTERFGDSERTRGPGGRGRPERPGDIERLDESGRISQGLADVIVHRLFAVGLDLHAALTYIEAGIADDVTIQKIHKAIGGLDGAIRDFRGVVLDLHPDGPDGRWPRPACGR